MATSFRPRVAKRVQKFPRGKLGSHHWMACNTTQNGGCQQRYAQDSGLHQLRGPSFDPAHSDRLAVAEVIPGTILGGRPLFIQTSCFFPGNKNSPRVHPAEISAPCAGRLMRQLTGTNSLQTRLHSGEPLGTTSSEL